jgi:hypothetical protein
MHTDNTQHDELTAAGYVPSAKLLTDTTPSHPQKPWTEMTPQGSSIFVTRSC